MASAISGKLVRGKIVYNAAQVRQILMSELSDGDDSHDNGASDGEQSSDDGDRWHVTGSQPYPDASGSMMRLHVVVQGALTNGLLFEMFLNFG